MRQNHIKGEKEFIHSSEMEFAQTKEVQSTAMY
jgi:hypothetical protein